MRFESTGRQPLHRALALSIVRERYADFGPNLTAEKLAAHRGCAISRETLGGSGNLTSFMFR
jgi:hypothetical protein